MLGVLFAAAPAAADQFFGPRVYATTSMWAYDSGSCTEPSSPGGPVWCFPYGSESRITSPDGQWAMVVQRNCDVGYYRNGVYQGWHAWAGVLRSKCALTMQSDGNLVLRAKEETCTPFPGYSCSWSWYVRWSSGTHGNPGAYLEAQNDGNFVIHAANGTVLWSLWHGRTY
jgi:hypothetical protein